MRQRTSDQFHCTGPILWLAVVLGAQIVLAQTDDLAPPIRGAVFTDDSPQAQDSLARAQTHLASGNQTEALRIYQHLLDWFPTRLVVTPGLQGNKTFVSVRRAVHDAIRSDPDLLAQYVRTQRDTADRLLEQAKLEQVYRSSFLCPAGLQAATLLAERALTRGQFDSADDLARQALDHPSLDPPIRRRAVFVRAWALAARGDSQTALQLLEQLAMDDPKADGARDQLQRELASLNIPISSGPVGAAQSLVNPRLPDLGRSPTWRYAVRQPTANPARQMPSRRNIYADPTGPDDPQYLAVMPVVAADMVCIDDGAVLRALDRFDGRQRWAHDYTGLMERSLSGPTGSALTSLQNDPSMPVVESNCVMAVMNAQPTRGDGSSLLVCHNLDSGAALWVKTPDDLSPDLAGGQFVGFPAADEGRAVLIVRKQTLRLASDYLVALDVQTGQYLWHQHIASAAIMGFYAVLPSIAPTIADGTVYISSPLGATAAVDARDGLVRWLDLDNPFTGANNSGITDPPWAFDLPVPTHTVLFAFSPDRRAVVAIDRDTGATIARTAVVAIGLPAYLVGSGDTVLAVGNTVARLTISGTAITPIPFQLKWEPNEEIIGRVAVGNDRILIPTAQRLLLTDLQGAIEAQVTIRQMSIPVLVGGEVLLAGSRYIESYIPFEIGQPRLQARLEHDPSDPNPAISLARLAFQHKRLDVLMTSVDRAVQIIEADPLSELNTQAQSRLFAGLLDMAPSPVLPEELSNALFTRLDAIAASPAQRLAYLLGYGANLARLDHVAQAVDAYQSVLDLPALALESWYENGVTRPAVNVATDRIAALIADHGAELYQPYQRQALRQWQDLQTDPTPDQALSLARRFPFSSIAPDACLAAARAYESAAAADPARRESALQALRFGMNLADTAQVPAPQIASEFLSLLLEMNRPEQAGRLLRVFERRDPDAIIPDRDAQPLSIRQWQKRIRQSAGFRLARPGLGTVRALADIRDGERLLVPVIGNSNPDLALIREGLSLIGLSGDGQMKFIERLDSSSKELILAADDHVILASLSSRPPRTIDRFSLTTQKFDWSTPSFDDFFKTALPPGTNEGRLFSALTQAGLVLVEEIGRAACIDLETGDVRWALRTDIDHVQDVGSQPFAVVMAGEKLSPGLRRSRRDIIANILRVLDPETGRTIYSLDTEPYEPIDQVHVSEAGLLVYRAQGAFHGVDLFAGREIWTIQSALLTDPNYSVLVGSTLIVLRESGACVRVDLRTGRPEVLQAVKPVERLELAPSIIEFRDRFVLRTHNGVYVLENDGTVTGLMAGSGSPNLTVLAVAAADDRVIALLSIDQETRGLPRTVQIAQLDETGRNLDLPYELDDRTQTPRPGGLIIINGAIVIDAGRDVVIVPAPVEPPPNS